MKVDLDLFFQLQALYTDYALVIDAGQWEDWPAFFIDECEYKLQPRENHERGFPLSTLSFESKGMLMDRAYAIRETLFHDPYYQRHVIGTPVVRALRDGVIHSEANYAVFRTKYNKDSTVFNVGRYIDEVVQTEQGLKFAKRWCIYDSEMIPNSIIYPI
ncbi:MAG: salicylate hydroxylase [Betaproteobacteria bacterium]|nr:salicylate hydroxylase [Betaproteobacteria bacterium]NBY04227.1 salicylate hydroxylase [Betaproteobacteria bacterium]